MTVMFSDIRNFSTLTDSLEPEELFHLLDRYLAEMTTLIHRYEGTLNKIIGDGMLIFFGDPDPDGGPCPEVGADGCRYAEKGGGA